MKKNVLLLVFIVSCSLFNATAQDTLIPITISFDSVPKYYLNNHFQYLADTAGDFTIKQVSSPEFNLKFVFPHKTKKGEGFMNYIKHKEDVKSKVFWYRFIINSNLKSNKEYLISYLEDDLELYIPTDSGKFTLVKSTSNFSDSNLEFNTDINSYLPFNLFAKNNQTFYLKTINKKKGILSTRFSIESSKFFIVGNYNSRFCYGLLLGILLIMMIYNLILYFSFRDKSYICYVLYLFSFALLWFCSMGFSSEYFWTNHKNWDVPVATFAAGATMFFYVLFGKVYLNLKQLLPKWNIVFKIQLIGQVLFFVLLLSAIDMMPTWGSIVTAIMFAVFCVSAIFIVIIPAIICLAKGYRPARYILLGNVAVIIFLSFTPMFQMFFNNSISSTIGFQFGVLAEIIIFSIGLGDRLQILNKEKAKAQEETIKQLTENEKLKDKVNRELEQKVTERTKEVVQQKQLVEEKNHEILDSISYAQRIQEAILPPLSDVISSLPNSFILFKPKDIVSGDFYWFYNSGENGERRTERSQESGVGSGEKNNELSTSNSVLPTPNSQLILIAACDCTGHGVPGAFMSTIASEKLNEAVGNSTDVSVMLQSVNIRMKKVLRQTDKEDSTHDGMDIALISFNKEKSELEYAGANRPMWIVRSSESGVGSEEKSGSTLLTPNSVLRSDSVLHSPNSELFETKATKTAIGGFTTDEQQFEKHKIKLNKGDTIYIFTDGFADQFSPENKKLMSKRFKELLLSINNKTMEEQKKYLDTFIENWKGDMEQTDDILVIGVRV